MDKHVYVQTPYIRQTSGAIQNAVPLQDFTSFSLAACKNKSLSNRENNN